MRRGREKGCNWEGNKDLQRRRMEQMATTLPARVMGHKCVVKCHQLSVTKSKGREGAAPAPDGIFQKQKGCD